MLEFYYTKKKKLFLNVGYINFLIFTEFASEMEKYCFGRREFESRLEVLLLLSVFHCTVLWNRGQSLKYNFKKKIIRGNVSEAEELAEEQSKDKYTNYSWIAVTVYWNNERCESNEVKHGPRTIYLLSDSY